jgi:pimeloyl-ACP methyl ester carboxylesterase
MAINHLRRQLIGNAHAGRTDPPAMPQTSTPRAVAEPPASGKSLFVTAQDGLRLHVRAYGARASSALPVVCLPGLARTAADFDVLALALSSDRGRQVLALDYRGRGKSDYDRNPANYNLQVELADVLAVLTALGIGRAAFVGTSRGGILTMLLATARPTAIAGCVLNDIGPVIESEGLMRIKSYVGKLPPPASFEEAADALRQLFGNQFPKWSDDDWRAFARRTFKEAGGRIVPDYDVRLATTLVRISPERPLPPLWKEFDALARIPLMVVRGTNSDILSVATVEAMRGRRRSLEVVEVADEGHAPRLTTPQAVSRIAAFVASCEAARSA